MQRARLDLMPAGTPVAADDVIVCDWKIVSEGETVADQKDAELHVHGRRSGGLEMEQDLSEALAGAKFGESREIKAKFLDSYPVEKWRGKEGALTVQIKEVRRPVAPELNEEFAKAMDFDSLEELKKAVSRSITQSKERDAALALEQQAFDQLLAATPFELPQGVLKAQARNIMLRQQYRLRQRGVPAEEIEKHMDDLRNASEECRRAQPQDLLHPRPHRREGKNLRDRGRGREPHRRHGRQLRPDAASACAPRSSRKARSPSSAPACARTR